MAGNESFSVCTALTQALNWTCTSAVPGFGNDPPITFKECLDGLVLAPWVTISFLNDQANGCPQQCANQATDGNCGPSTCSDAPGEQPGTTITVGNISCPDGVPIPVFDQQGNWAPPFWDSDDTDLCSASIKSFQYTFDNTGGATCKVQIIDEKGSSFEYWINKMVRNIECSRQLYKMKVEFGWIGLNPDDPKGEGCSTDFTTDPIPCNLYCQPPTDDCPGGDTCDPSVRPCGARIIARSGPLYFLPREVNSSLQQGKFTYEITGVDLFRTANEQKYPGSFPDETQTDTAWRFKRAVEALLAQATPSIDFQMFNIPICGGAPEPMKFWVPPAQGHPIDVMQRQNAPCRDGPPDGPTDTRPPCQYQRVVETMFNQDEGPLDQWKGNNKPLYDVLRDWIKNVRADDGSCEGHRHGKGIIMNWDNTCPTPRLLMWADPFPTCSDQAQIGNGNNRCIGTYIVGGGKCSPVIRFEPNMKYIFNAAMRSGGVASPVNANNATYNNSTSGGTVSGVMPSPCNVSGGRGVRIENTVTNGQAVRNGPSGAIQEAMGNAQVHERAHAIQGALPIEAELTVQGDPTIGSVLNSIGKTCGIIVINPFYIRDDGVNADPLHTPGCPYWSTVTASPINEMLTNKNWYIRGVDHQIKEGEFTTRYKLYLPAPGADLGADAPLGGAGGPQLQPQGGFAAPGENPNGSNCPNINQKDPGAFCCNPADDPNHWCGTPGIPPCPPGPCPVPDCP